MIIKVTAGSNSKGFVIGTKPLSEYNSKQEGAALAYLLADNLPYGTVKHLANSLQTIIKDQSFSENEPYYQEFKQCAKELEVT